MHNKAAAGDGHRWNEEQKRQGERENESQLPTESVPVCVSRWWWQRQRSNSVHFAFVVCSAPPKPKPRKSHSNNRTQIMKKASSLTESSVSVCVMQFLGRESECVQVSECVYTLTKEDTASHRDKPKEEYDNGQPMKWRNEWWGNSWLGKLLASEQASKQAHKLFARGESRELDSSHQHHRHRIRTRTSLRSRNPSNTGHKRARYLARSVLPVLRTRHNVQAEHEKRTTRIWNPQDHSQRKTRMPKSGKILNDKQSQGSRASSMAFCKVRKQTNKLTQGSYTKVIHSSTHQKKWIIWQVSLGKGILHSVSLLSNARVDLVAWLLLAPFCLYQNSTRSIRMERPNWNIVTRKHRPCKGGRAMRALTNKWTNRQNRQKGKVETTTHSASIH